MQRFTDRVVLVTGAGSGIGRATAVRLAQEGAALMLADINPGGLAETAALVAETGARVEQHTADVSQAEQCRELVAATVAAFDRLDVLCNIAGIALCKHLADISEDDWGRMVSINLNSVFFTSQAAMPHLIASKGNIVNMSSTAALVGQVYNAAYCATKGAVSMLSKSMAIEFSRQGVRVNAVCPGGVATPLTANFSMPEGANVDLFQRLMPLLEMAQPEEIAAAVAYLASDEARFVTGTDFRIDGGQTAG